MVKIKDANKLNTIEDFDYFTQSLLCIADTGAINRRHHLQFIFGNDTQMIYLISVENDGQAYVENAYRSYVAELTEEKYLEYQRRHNHNDRD